MTILQQGQGRLPMHLNGGKIVKMPFQKRNLQKIGMGQNIDYSKKKNGTWASFALQLGLNTIIFNF